MHTGRSEPYETTEIRPGSSPFETRYFITDMARFSPTAMFADGVPRSSLCPSIRTWAPGFSLSQRTTASSAGASAWPTVTKPARKRTSVSSGRAAKSCDRAGPVDTGVAVAVLGAAGVAGVAVATAGSLEGSVDDHVFQNCHELPAHPARAVASASDPTVSSADPIRLRIL